MDNFVAELDGNTDAASSRSVKDREMERRRARGEASCAECRRLKLKCDKKLPCSTCVRRGCPTICPNGTIASRHGNNKFVLADTEKLHTKLLEMSRRIRQLEDALQIAQASLSPSSHPLLAEDLLSIKNGVDAPDALQKELSNPDWDIHTSFGTLSISDGGETRFVGRSSSEALMVAVEGDEVWDRLKPKLPSDIAYLTETFPFTPVHLPKEQVLGMIKERLPSYERATALIEAYLQHLSWFFRPVERAQIMEELVPRFYKHKTTTTAAAGAAGAPPGAEAGLEAHQLALLFGVFAAGSAGDMTMEPYSAEGELYRQLGRAALGIHSIFDGTSLVTVQALALISVYDFFSCNTQTLDTAWKLVSMALCLASSIGLHWDPTSWDLDAKQIQRRRSVFWELSSFDSWKSLGSGRPAVFHAHEIDCRYPEDTDAEIGDDGKTVPGFWAWKHDFGRNIIAAVADRLCTVRPTKYSEILELDRKVRDFKFTNCRSPVPIASADPQTTLGFTMTLIYKEITLLFIHRNFFARAMQENPTNPVRSRFAPSFLSAYASSITILRTLRRESAKGSNPLLRRQWPLWAHALAAAVIVGTVAARDTPSELSRAALVELEHAIALFDLMTGHPVVRNGLPMLLRIREKARSRADGGSPQDSTPSSGVKNEDVDEVLSIIGGATRFVRKVRHLRGSPASGSPSPGASTGIPSPSSKDRPLSTPLVPPPPASFTAGMGANAGSLASTFGTREFAGGSVSDRSGAFDQSLHHHQIALTAAREGYQHQSVDAAQPVASSSGATSTLWAPPYSSSNSQSQPPFAPPGVPPAHTSQIAPGFEPTYPAPAATDAFMHAFAFNAEFPDLLPSMDLPMSIDDMMSFDFDVGGGGGMSAISDPDPATKAQRELLPFSDSTIAHHAWHSILEDSDPRFASSGGGTGHF